MIFETGRSLVKQMRSLLPRPQTDASEAGADIPASTEWPDVVGLHELQLITDSVVELAGFALAVISIATTDGALVRPR